MTSQKQFERNLAIRQVERIRARNNRCWVDLLRLAVEARPRKAKAILKKILDNDREVTRWLSRI